MNDGGPRLWTEAAAAPPELPKPSATPFESVALLLQGGGALGAYQAGVYERLVESDIEPTWIAGISIGAINSAIIAGNRREHRVAQVVGDLGHRHVLAEGIRYEIDLVAERGEGADAVELAERGAARLEERLGRDHQDAHGSGDFRTK